MFTFEVEYFITRPLLCTLAVEFAGALIFTFELVCNIKLL